MDTTPPDGYWCVRSSHVAVATRRVDSSLCNVGGYSRMLLALLGSSSLSRDEKNKQKKNKKQKGKQDMCEVTEAAASHDERAPPFSAGAWWW